MEYSAVLFLFFLVCVCVLNIAQMDIVYAYECIYL